MFALFVVLCAVLAFAAAFARRIPLGDRAAAVAAYAVLATGACAAGCRDRHEPEAPSWTVDAAHTVRELVCAVLPPDQPEDTPAWQRALVAAARALLCDDGQDSSPPPLPLELDAGGVP